MDRGGAATVLMACRDALAGSTTIPKGDRIAGGMPPPRIGSEVDDDPNSSIPARNAKIQRNLKLATLKVMLRRLPNKQSHAKRISISNLILAARQQHYLPGPNGFRGKSLFCTLFLFSYLPFADITNVKVTPRRALTAGTSCLFMPCLAPGEIGGVSV